MLLGTISLNIAFILYLISYFPQLKHNQQDRHLRELSLSYHYLLLFAYGCDLFYAFALQMPWQYKTVSIVGLLCLLYQHYQLWRLHASDHSFKGLTIIGLGLSIISYNYLLTAHLSTTTNLFIGYLSQLCFLIYLCPQVLKNIKLASARSLNLTYLLFSWSCCLCDTIAAWCLHWPLPNKMGSVIRLLLSGLLLCQWYYYHVKLTENSSEVMI